MATEDAKPEFTLITEQETEGKEVDSDASDLQVNKFPHEGQKHEESLPVNSQRSVEYLMDDKEEYTKVSNDPAVTKIDPEIFHLGVDVLDETKTQTAEFSEMVSMEGDDISPDYTVPKKHNETEEEKSGNNEEGPDLRNNQSTAEVEENHAESSLIQKSPGLKSPTNYSHVSLPLEQASPGEESPSVTPIQEQGAVKHVEEELNDAVSNAHDTPVENTIQEDRGAPKEKILEVERTDEQNNITEQVEKDKPNQDLTSSTEETCMDSGIVYNQNSKEEYINREAEHGNLPAEYLRYSVHDIKLNKEPGTEYEEIQEKKHEEPLPKNYQRNDPEILHSGVDVLDETKTKTTEFSEMVSMEGDSIYPDHAVPKKHDEPEEGKSGHREEGPVLRSNQSNVEPEDSHAESSPVQKSPEIIKPTDYSHVSLPLEQASTGEEFQSVTPIQEQGAVKCVEEKLNDTVSNAHDTTVEDTIQEERGTPKEEISEVQRTDDQNNIAELEEEDKPNQDLTSSTDETYMDSGMVYNQNSKEGYINQEAENGNSPPEEVNRDISPSSLAVEEETAKQASTEAGGSLQEFQSDAQTDEAAEEDCCIVTSDEIPKSVVPETVKELLEVPIPTSSEETKESKEDLAYIPNVVPQVSEENSVDQEAIEKENDIIGRDALQMKPGKEEASADKASIDGTLIDTSNISPHEGPQKAIKSEDIDYENYLPGLASKDQTTKQEQGDKESIIETAEECAAGETKSVAENELQTVEYHNVDQPLENSSTEVTSLDQDCRSTEAVFETNVAKVSSAEALGDSLEEMPSVKLPNQETALTSSEGKSDGTDTDENIVYEATDASFVTSLKEEFQNEGCEPVESNFRDSPGRDMDGECHGTESESKEYLSKADDPLEGKSEKAEEPSIEKKAEDAEITGDEHLALYQSLGNQSTVTDEQNLQTTEPLSIENQTCKLQQDTSTSRELREESEIYKEKHTAKEKDQIEDKSSAEDSSCDFPEQELSQKNNQKDEQKQEADPNADVLLISNQLKESETTEDTQSLTTEVDIQDRDVKMPTLVSFADEAVKCTSVQEGYITDDALVPHVDSELKVDDTSDVLYNVSQNTKLEDTEKVSEEPSQVSTAQITIDCTPAEEGKVDDHDRNSTKEGDHQHEIPETINSESKIVKMTDSQEMTDEGKFIITEEPRTVSTSEEIEIYTFEEKEEKITNDIMARDESNAKADLEGRENEKPEFSPMSASQITKVVSEGAPQAPNSEETINYNSAVERKEERNFSNTATNELNPDMIVGDISKAEIDSNEDTKPEETDMTEATQSLKNQVDEEPNPGLTAEETINQTPAEEEKDNGLNQVVVINSTKDNGLNSQIYTGVAKDEIFDTINSGSPGTKMTIDDKAIIIERPQQFSTSEETVHYDLPRAEKINIHVQEPAIEELNEKECSETRIDEAPGTKHCSSESEEFEEPPNIDVQRELKQGEDVAGVGHSQPPHSEEIMENLPAEKNEEGNVDATEIPAEVKLDVAGSEISEPISNLNESTQLEELETSGPNWTFNKQTASEGSIVEVLLEIENCESNAQVTISKVESHIEGSPNIEGEETSEIPGTASETTKLEETDIIDATQKCEDQIDEEPFQVVTAEKTINHTSAEVEEEGSASNPTKEDGLRSEANTEETKDEKISETACTESQSAMMTNATQVSEETIEEPRQVSTSEEIGDYSPAKKESIIINDTTVTDELNQKVSEPETINDTESSRKHMQGGEIVDAELPQLSNTEEIVYRAVERKEERTVSDATVVDNEFHQEGMVIEISSEENNLVENIKLEEGITTEATWCSNTQMAHEEKTVEVPSQDSSSNKISSQDLSDNEHNEGVIKDTAIDELKIEGNLNIHQINDTADIPSMESEDTKLKKHELVDVTESVVEKDMPAEDISLESPCNSPVVEEVIAYNPENTMFDETEIKHTTQSFEEKCPGDDKVAEGKIPVSVVQEEPHSSLTLEGKEEMNIKVGMPTLEQTDEVHSTETETNARTSNTKDSSIKVGSEPNLITTEGLSPDIEDREATNNVYDSTMEIGETDVPDPRTDAIISGGIHMPSESPTAESNLEIMTNQSPKTDNIPKIASQDEEVAIKQIDSAGEILNVEVEKMELEDTSKSVSNTMSAISKECSSNDAEKEEKVKELVKLSSPTSVKKLHEHENDSTTEIQNEPDFLHKRPTEATSTEGESREVTNQIDSSSMKIEQNDDLAILQEPTAVHTPFESSIPVSDVGNMERKDPNTEANAKIAGQGEEEMTIIYPTDGDASLQPEVEKLEPEGEVITEEVSIIMQDSSSKEQEIAEKFQEQGNISTQTRVTKLNEEEKVRDQNEYQSALAIGHDSAREAESERLLLGKKPTEGMLLDSREAIEQNNSLIDVAESEAIHLPFKISDAGLDMEITATEDSKTGVETKIASQDKEMSILEKSLLGETLQTETKKLEPESTSNAVAQAVSSSPQEISFKNDEMGANAKEQVQHSDQESVQNEDKEEYMMEHSSTSNTQNEQSLNNRPTDEMLTQGKVLIHAGEMLPEIQHGEAKEETTKSASEESMTSLEDLLQTSRNGNVRAAEDSNIENEPTIPGSDVKEGNKPYSDEDKGEEDTKGEAASDSPVLVEASRDADVKITPKKSNSILSGVGSKVKNSIAKVKKVITGKSSSPKPSSPT